MNRVIYVGDMSQQAAPILAALNPNGNLDAQDLQLLPALTGGATSHKFWASQDVDHIANDIRQVCAADSLVECQWGLAISVERCQQLGHEIYRCFRDHEQVGARLLCRASAKLVDDQVNAQQQQHVQEFDRLLIAMDTLVDDLAQRNKLGTSEDDTLTAMATDLNNLSVLATSIHSTAGNIEVKARLGLCIMALHNQFLRAMNSGVGRLLFKLSEESWASRFQDLQEVESQLDGFRSCILRQWGLVVEPHIDMVRLSETNPVANASGPVAVSLISTQKFKGFFNVICHEFSTFLEVWEAAGREHGQVLPSADNATTVIRILPSFDRILFVSLANAYQKYDTTLEEFSDDQRHALRQWTHSSIRQLHKVAEKLLMGSSSVLDQTMQDFKTTCIRPTFAELVEEANKLVEPATNAAGTGAASSAAAPLAGAAAAYAAYPKLTLPANVELKDYVPKLFAAANHSRDAQFGDQAKSLATLAHTSRARVVEIASDISGAKGFFAQTCMHIVEALRVQAAGVAIWDPVLAKQFETFVLLSRVIRELTSFGSDADTAHELSLGMDANDANVEVLKSPQQYLHKAVSLPFASAIQHGFAAVQESINSIAAEPYASIAASNVEKTIRPIFFNRTTVALSPRIDYMNKLWHRIKQQRAMLDVANSDTRFLEIWANANVRRMACLEFDFTLEAMNILWNNFKGASRESKVSFVR